MQAGLVEQCGTLHGGAQDQFLAIADIRTLFADKCYAWIFAGVTLMGANVWAAGTWTPTFFSRVHHMGLAEIAGTIGPTRGFIGAAGVLCGGLLIIDRLPASRIRWRLAVPALGCLLAGPAEAVFLLGSDRAVWFAAFALTSFVTRIHQGPVYAATVNIVPERQRALAIALLLFGASFIGNVVGPSAVGFVTDLFTPRYGDMAIRHSMLIIAVTPVITAVCLMRVARLYGERAHG